jgi:hypothetical protein
VTVISVTAATDARRAIEEKVNERMKVFPGAYTVRWVE